MAVTINDKERVYGLAVTRGNAFEIHQRAEAKEYIYIYIDISQMLQALFVVFVVSREAEFYRRGRPNCKNLTFSIQLWDVST